MAFVSVYGLFLWQLISDGAQERLPGRISPSQTEKGNFLPVEVHFGTYQSARPVSIDREYMSKNMCASGFRRLAQEDNSAT